MVNCLTAQCGSKMLSFSVGKGGDFHSTNINRKKANLKIFSDGFLCHRSLPKIINLLFGLPMSSD